MNKMTEKQLDNLFSFDAGDILSLNIFGGVYNNNSMSIVFNAESKYSEINKLRITTDIMLDLIQNPLKKDQLIVAKKNGKFWYVMGRHQSEEV